MSDTGEGSIMVSPFAVEVSGDPSAPIVVVRGEVDVATSPQLRNALNALIARGARAITIEFGEVSFVDSSGLGVLVGTYKRLRDEGHSDRILARTGLRIDVYFSPTKLAWLLDNVPHAREQAERGAAILLISTELDEVVSLASRVGVLYGGRLMGIVPPDTPREVLGLMMGGHPPAEPVGPVDE